MAGFICSLVAVVMLLTGVVGIIHSDELLVGLSVAMIRIVLACTLFSIPGILNDSGKGLAVTSIAISYASLAVLVYYIKDIPNAITWLSMFH